jgi:enhancing lycopene biosynthesis protein 2
MSESLGIIETISSLLYEADPVGTMCVENELTDEYYSEAAYISGLITDSSTVEQIHEAIVETMDEFFEDCVVDSSSFDEISHKIKNIMGN